MYDSSLLRHHFDLVALFSAALQIKCPKVKYVLFSTCKISDTGQQDYVIMKGILWNIWIFVNEQVYFYYDACLIDSVCTSFLYSRVLLTVDRLRYL